MNIATDFGNNDDVVAEDNDFTGGTASLGLQGEGEALTNVKVRNNRRVD